MSMKIQPVQLARYLYLVDRISRDQAEVGRLRPQIMDQYPEGIHEVESPGGTIVVTVEADSEGTLFCFVNYKDEMGDGYAK